MERPSTEPVLQDKYLRQLQNMDTPPNPEPRSKRKGYIKYAGMATQMMFIIGLFVFSGVQLDRQLASSPLFSLILSLSGVGAALYLFIKQALEDSWSKPLSLLLMTTKQFYGQLIILSSVMALILAFLHRYEWMQPYQSLSWLSWGFFIAFSVGVFYACAKSAKSENQQLFGQLFLLSVVFKLVFCGLLLIGFMLLVRPGTRYFAYPFLLIYTVYTIYEVYFVTKLAK